VVNVNSNSFTLLFAVIACVVSGTLLSAASLGLKEKQEINIKIDKQKSVLSAAGLLGEGDSPETISGWFDGDSASITSYLIEEATGNKFDEVSVELYLKKPSNYPELSLIYESNKVGSECFILPIVGKGLWGKMFGYLALSKDADNVLGIKFYNHKETPGLGAEITEPWFIEQFQQIEGKGKKLLRSGEGAWDERFEGITVLKGLSVADLPAEKQPYAVDGISGATITSVGVQGILIKQIRDTYGPFLKQQ